MTYDTRASSPGEATPLDRVRVLLSTYLFRDLTAAELAPLAHEARLVRLERGQAAFRVGDPADSLFVVASGQVKECVIGEDGEEVIFEVFAPGGIEGEPGLFAVERDRVVDLVAMERSVLLGIGREPLLAFLADRPIAMLRMLEGLATMARNAVDDQATLAGRRIRDRVGIKLLELASTHGRPDGTWTRIDLPLSQGTLAGMTGASRENVNRSLGRLAAEGFVRMNGHDLLVDVPGLTAATGAEVPRHRRNRRLSLSQDM